ncbi:MAG TPA: ECF transporter S component [Lachnospiraceae bacterium]|nr:ECF transporter S component [Lachnospiraceae bacterium]
MKQKSLKNMILSAMFIAIGLVLPFFTGQIPQVGNMLLPMHFPVFLCGLICGWQYGLIVGFILPILRYFIFGMPILFPIGISMAFELATYGLVAGAVYGLSRWKCMISLYKALILAMISGRVVWGIVRICLLGLTQEAFTWKMFMAGALFNAIPGIILQFVLIPAIMIALDKTGMVHFSNHKKLKGETVKVSDHKETKK